MTSARSRLDVATLTPCDVAGRLDRLREPMVAAGLDALLVTRTVNVRYLTGFTGSAALLLVLLDDAVFVSDGRYAEQAGLQLGAHGVTASIEISNHEQRELLQVALARAGTPVERLGLEAHGVTWAQQQDFAESWFPAVELVATNGLVEDLRRRKDPGELARIRAACAIADDALAECLGRLADGPTEQEFALELEIAMRRRGASGNSFDPIVAGGPNGARPHARVSDRVIRSGELVILDFGCVVDGYCSDMTRTVSVGDPGPEARRLWDLVHEAQAAGRDAVRAGVETVAVDVACRDVITAGGHGDHFTHGTGHGVGLEIHEAPRVGPRARDTLADRDIVTVEPGVYLRGVGGVRIEDSVVVTESGCELLTHTPKVLCV
jgi:Xaa-Pro aminopeptidase